MLNRLDISNYALIENVSLQFTKGFTVITGETGAGKSILLKALNLLLGERADTSVIKQSEKKCILEAQFDIKALNLQSFFKQNELDYDDECILRREFTASGKSRGFINDTPVQLNQLKALGEQLIAIHAQHQTLALFDKSFQLDVIDAFAGITNVVSDYKQQYRTYRQKVNEHAELKVRELENRKEKDYLSFLIKELEMAELENTNLEELKKQYDLLENAEKIAEKIGLAKSVTDNDTYGPQVGIKTLLDTFEELKEYSDQYIDLHSRLLSLKIELDDLTAEIEDQQLNNDLNENEAQAVKDKMELLNSLTFKHSLTEIDELIQLKEKLEDQLNDIDSTENQVEQLGQEIEALKKQLNTAAQKIAKQRKAVFKELTEKVDHSLDQLAMEDAALQIDHQVLEKISANGFDEVEFLFRTNKGGNFLPIKKLASGGELSRLMLSVLSLLSEHKNLPTLIFDEIDTGVSGEVAAKMASEFQKMGGSLQLIAITHLPQVAGKGKQHFHVYKEVKENKTVTSVSALSGNDRVEELAKMMSGEEITMAAKQNAEQLLKNT